MTQPESSLQRQAFFDSAPMGVMLTHNRMIVQANALCADMLRYALDELVGKPASILWPDGEAYLELGRQAGPLLASGQRFGTEMQAVRKDGSIFWCRFSAKAVDPQRTQDGTLWIMEDTTVAHETEERNQRIFNEQQMIFDNAAVGIMFATRRKVVRCNRRMAAIFGYEPDELLGRSTRVFYESDEEYRSAGIAGYGPILAGDAYVHEMRITHKSGNRFWVRATGRQVPLSIPGEDVVWIFEDVSDRRDAQAALHQANEALEAHVEDLKRTQADLVQAEKLASLGALVAGVAHELNTPLGNALMSASTLQEHMLTMRDAVERGELRRSALDKFLKDGVDIANLVLRSCDRAAQLVSSFKQVAVDQTSEQRRPFELNALVGNLVATLKPMFRTEPWVIDVNIPDGIQCDSYPGPLGQVVANLVNNAVTHAFSARQHGALRISAIQQGELVEMRFVDDGHGIDASSLPRIFDPFFTTRMGQGGSGLGLSISRNIATSVLGGTLNVTSLPGQGSCFTLTFPQKAPDAPL
jgi:PAS domain S-box-containing protein